MSLGLLCAALRSRASNYFAHYLALRHPQSVFSSRRATESSTYKESWNVL